MKNNGLYGYHYGFRVIIIHTFGVQVIPKPGEELSPAGLRAQRSFHVPSVRIRVDVHSCIWVSGLGFRVQGSGFRSLWLFAHGLFVRTPCLLAHGAATRMESSS